MKKVFYKYHCLGNSFIIIPYIENVDYNNLAKKICSKEYGVGADGLIVAKTMPYEMKFFNQDGSEAKFCGNGIRAYVAYLCKLGLVRKNQTISVLFSDEFYECTLINLEPFICKVKIPHFETKIETKWNQFKPKVSLLEKLAINDRTLLVSLIKVGVLHLVIINDTSKENSEFLKETEINEIIDAKVCLEIPNIDIVKIIEKGENSVLEVLTFERGVGFTKSCGSGAVASSLICHFLGLTGRDVIINYLKNISPKNNESEMFVSLKKDGVMLYGPASFIAWGEYDE